ncbi:HEPN domain-containing protein [Ralstonia solanacearum]|uniref:RiboL-PSP-HEPN domain-containing protein n=1 Tax=Ralstonia solanacearum TaxID=305 RepID=A0AAE3T662_RALSL|nr:HEPN domain-containing protein [Ralstonia solanacearum]MBB6581801.1 hypothetical protein [Ralstonia solanacearum]MDB0523618.1 hypothetical protein [Ralstonia solanacearum]
MNAHKLFSEAWLRCDTLAQMHAYLASTTTRALSTDELLRAEWVARVAALDSYVHELVAQGMIEVFKGQRVATPAYQKFSLRNDVVDRIRCAATPEDAAATFDLEIRRQLGFITFQTPEAIADGVRLISSLELWNEVAIQWGAPGARVNTEAKVAKRQLSLIVERRNKIAHEGDMQPVSPREPWPISSTDLREVRSFIENLVRSVDALVVCSQ